MPPVLADFRSSTVLPCVPLTLDRMSNSAGVGEKRPREEAESDEVEPVIVAVAGSSTKAQDPGSTREPQIRRVESVQGPTSVAPPHRIVSQLTLSVGTPTQVAETDVSTAAGGAPQPQKSNAAKRKDLKMPQEFFDKLGAVDEPEEAADIEEIIMGHVEFADLPQDRKDALAASVKTLLTRAKPGLSDREQAAVVKHASHLHGFPDCARKSELIAAYRILVREGSVQPSELVESMLLKKKGKSHSGVLVITVLMGPGKFSCPKNCHYCPDQPGIARSYLLREPGVLRGFRNGWDPIRQFNDRASALENNGHVVDKIELIILGGTFSFYPKDYARDFIAASFYAANIYYESAPFRPMLSLEEEITLNETARCRIIGLTVETRPDYISKTELKRFRSLGVTRVQLGIQHLDDDVLERVNRECPTEKAKIGIQRLLNAGFKVDAHWMPDLPGSSYEKDLNMFKYLLGPENTEFQVDQWKVYPTMTVPFTKIKEWYDQGLYKPYAEEENGQKMVNLLLYILENCPHKIRLNRIVRDIPNSYIMGGENRPNLRQLLEVEMAKRGTVCKDIRERECKGQQIKRSEAKIFMDSFETAGGTEYYLSIENPTRTVMYGHLRLRLRSKEGLADNLFPALEGAALIRELHTYGKLVAVSENNTGKEAQHVGVGKDLMRRAEEISAENGFRKVAVIAGVGVRGYYAKLGYSLQDTYMVKQLAEPTPAALQSLAAEKQTEPPPVKTSNGFLSRVKSLLGL